MLENHRILKHLLFFPTRYFPSISGAEFYMQRMAEIFKQAYALEVDVLTSNAVDFKALREPTGKTITEQNKYFFKVNGVPITRFKIEYNKTFEDKIKELRQFSSYRSLEIEDHQISKFLKNGPYLPFNSLVERIGDAKPDLIHATFFPYFNLILALMLGNEFGVPTTCTPFFHFSNPRYLDEDLLTLLKKFDLLIACTHLEKKKLISLLSIPQMKIKVISMGVDHHYFSSSDSNLSTFQFKKKYIKNKKKVKKSFMVLFCGYKNHEKGAISILHAIPSILKQEKNVYFVFIGPSTTAFNRELAKLKINSDVKVINFTPDNLTGYYDKKKIAAFKECDVYVMPSRSDAFGIAFLEAWASKKPVIGANIGATPEVIKENVDGLLVRFDDPKDIAEKILFLLKKKRLRKKMGIKGFDKVKKYYTWDIIAKKTLDAYRTLIS